MNLLAQIAVNQLKVALIAINITIILAHIVAIDSIEQI